ncbi:prephenate dehydrogenase [Nitrospina gracilis]|uniref:prephenate dehydrogenase n=1 Tax=Nitrospina gracilis TaxID=35801 RepID=UPI001F2BD791|nr:prephenate dehydrogenase/arogenate dehydrogenase family protein [Nitrospina gracilis]MCF8719314.1 prephenate dehydrogenase [Nitrospina gracilis Nb-211]
MQPFSKITIIGVGLLGASLAKVCKERKLADNIAGFGRSADNLKRAGEQGVIDHGTTDLKDAVAGADLVVLCSPVASIADRFREMAPHLSAGCLVTDVGSVKAPLVRDIEPLLPEGVHYVPAHPIAGAEKSGLDASTADLYEGARCILTPTENTDPAALERIQKFWEAVGMRVQILTADEHDFIYGAVSHLPHVVAFALINAIGQLKTSDQEDILNLSAGGLRDITRIASSDPVMWRDICLANKTHVLDLIGRFSQSLEDIRKQIEQGDGAGLEKSFKNANGHRGKLVGQNS